RPRGACTTLAIRHINAPRFDLEVRQIPAENLAFWLGDESTEKANERNSYLILKKSLTLGGANDAPTLSFLHLDKLFPDLKHGVLELSLSADKAKDARRLLFTDINLIAKRETGSGRVWVSAIDINDLS